LPQAFRIAAAGHQTKESSDAFQCYFLKGGLASVKTDEPQKPSQMPAMSLAGALGQTAIFTQMLQHTPDGSVGRPCPRPAPRLQALALFEKPAKGTDAFGHMRSAGFELSLCGLHVFVGQIPQGADTTTQEPGDQSLEGFEMEPKRLVFVTLAQRPTHEVFDAATEDRQPKITLVSPGTNLSEWR
jgi:hypothetical protein